MFTVPILTKYLTYERMTRNKERFCVYKCVPYCEFRLYFFHEHHSVIANFYTIMESLIASSDCT